MVKLLTMVLLVIAHGKEEVPYLVSRIVTIVDCFQQFIAMADVYCYGIFAQSNHSPDVMTRPVFKSCVFILLDSESMLKDELVAPLLATSDDCRRLWLVWYP